MPLLKFKLTMPRVGSWNGKFSAAEKQYLIFKTLPKLKADDLDGKSFFYNFGDGWVAEIDVSIVKRRTKSDGFMDYEWMVNSIIEVGTIVYTENGRQ